MKLISPGFEHGGPIPSTYTCDGSDTSPPLKIEGVPADAESLVLIMEDPDVPPDIHPDGMWDHWIIFNMPPDTTEILEGYEPPGDHGTGTSGNTNYHGPCPPDGEHRYFFRLFALDIKLDTKPGATKDEIEQAMVGHVLDKTELMGRYAR